MPGGAVDIRREGRPEQSWQMTGKNAEWFILAFTGRLLPDERPEYEF
jgi:hypothetical protein